MVPRARTRWVSAAIVAVVVSWSPFLAVADDDPSAPSIPVSGGVYSLEQAEAGREAFAAHCAHCHGSDLRGGYGPRLVPLDPWAFGGQPLSRVFEIMVTEMPFDAPGTLDLDVYASILAFVLLEHGFAAGADPLPADLAALATYRLDDPPAD